MLSESAKNIERHLKVLTKDIGARLAGSVQEKQAADYIASEFRKFSKSVRIETFPVKERAVSYEKLEVLIGKKWIEFPCSLFNLAPDTDGKTVEAEIVFFDTASGYQRKDLSFLSGKAAVHLGCHIENEQNYRRLMEAKPAFILFVDTRFTGTVNLADGLFPSYVEKYGAAPSLNTGYFDAWKWKRENAKKARICVKGGQKAGKTTVVVCELPGSVPDSGIIYAGGHHDTQAGTVGADDNACGAAAVLELAAILSKKKFMRTIRLCSFGAEEQLSFGSASYIRKHKNEIEQNGIFMCNFDSFGSALGWNSFLVNGTARLRRLIANEFNARDIYYKETVSPCPYTDQFPFAACKVPGIWISRNNCEAGHYYHHRNDNVMENLDCSMMAEVIHASAAVIGKIASAVDVGEIRKIPRRQQLMIDKMFKETYGGF